MKKIIVVTGGIGAGKSVVCSKLAKFGATVIEGDKAGHNCLKPDGAAYSEVVAEFGVGILNADGTISRDKLGRIAFANRENLERLNSATHKHILREIVDSIDKIDGCGTIVLEIPLFRAVDFEYDASICVIADEKLRVERILERGGLTREVAEHIIAMQPTTEEYREFADYCIENDGDFEGLLRQVCEVYENITKELI